MQAFHDSRQRRFRTPFGAARLGEAVTIALDVWDGVPNGVTLRLWFEETGEALIPMEPHQEAGCIHFTAMFAPEGLGNYWYSFILERVEGEPLYYGARDGATGGAGQLYEEMPPSFQLTCYRPRPAQPRWYREGIVYQIFPDRFKRGEGWRERAEAEVAKPRNGVPRALVEDWDAPIGYERDAVGKVTRWDFYGGTLEGIREKLPRLAEWGITAIYLNPIFQATSNHRYDTGDYERIDPLLGDKEDFCCLAADARELGIDVILDGVFNHTGDDSRYFNRYANYPEVGAWQSEDSPYRDWYLLSEDGKYQSWWGVADLPAMDKTNPAWQAYIYGPGGIVETWSRAGARGWRLDVADELTDEFIAGIKAAQTRIYPEGLLLGEVWEDASNKVSYGTMRHYLNGNELDSVMNYPLRVMLLGFLTGRIDAAMFADQMMTLYENYPAPAFYETLNLLGSHDRARLTTVLGDAPLPTTLTPEELATFRLSDEDRGKAKGRFWLAVLVQMTLAGVPCIYYGDEVGAEGYTDPYNRGTYPWGHEDPDMLTMTSNAIALRRRFDFFVDGGFEPQAFDSDVFGFWRWRVDATHDGAPDVDPLLVGDRGPGGWRSAKESALILVNRSPFKTCEVRLPLPEGGLKADELVRGKPVRTEGETGMVELFPFGSAVVYFHEPSTIAQRLEPGRGILCAVQSLPTTDGAPGTLGEPAFKLVDFLADCGLRYWQVLPVTPPDSFGSPYAGLSAFAGNIAFVDTALPLEELFELFMVEERVGFDRFGTVVPASGYAATAVATREDFERFVAAQASWLAPFALFMALKVRYGDEVVWQQWPREIRELGPRVAEAAERPFTAKDLAEFSPADGRQVLYYAFTQWLFDVQWHRLATYASERGVTIIGDIPIYVSEDSADTWSHPEMFNLDKDGYATEIAGTPPDRFCEDGQLWSNPTYNWNALKADGYRWWIERFRRVLCLYGCVRLDHFLGFEHYYSVKRGLGAGQGRWLAGPGLEFFERARAELGPLPFIAEDLGSITPAIRGLVAQTGFPAMDVVEFADGDVRWGYTPVPGKVVYTSTHDTDTLLGWVNATWFGGTEPPQSCEPEAVETVKPEVATAEEARVIADRLIGEAYGSQADVVIIPLQDAIGLGTEGRMNVPGRAAGNWRWQATPDELELARERLKRLRP